MGLLLRQPGSAWLRHPVKRLRGRAAAGRFLSAERLDGRFLNLNVVLIS